MTYTPTNWVSTTTPCSAANMNNLETQYTQASTSFAPELITGFVVLGLVATRDGSILNQLDVTAGTAYLLQTADNTLQRKAIASSAGPLTTATPSTTYFLDLNPSGAYNFATTHSAVTGHLTIASCTTDGSGNILVVTDARPLNTTLFSTALGQIQVPKFGSDGGMIYTDGLGTLNFNNNVLHASIDAMGTMKTAEIALPTVLTGTPVSGAGLGIGVYKYAVVFNSVNGASLPGAQATVTTTTGNQKVNLTAIPTGPTGIISRTIYRTAVGGTSLLLLTTISDNTTTTFTDTTADGSLGAAAPVHSVMHGLTIRTAGGVRTASIYGDGAFYFDTGAINSDGAGDLVVNTISTFQTASAAATGTGGTISTTGIGISRTNPAGNITGVILQAGVNTGQQVWVTNESAFTITFAALATSNVYDGVSDVIAAKSGRLFVWLAAQTAWVRAS
jgi:hypothetical protein